MSCAVPPVPDSLYVLPKSGEESISVGGEGCHIRGFDSRAIQLAVDILRARGGGAVRLAPGTYAVSAPIRLSSGISVRGAGESTVLFKEDGTSSPLAVDAGYGELTVTLEDASAFRPGMGVRICEENDPNSWHTTTTIVTSVEGNTLHLADHLAMDYDSDRQAVASSAYSIIEAVNVRDVSISDLAIDGNGGNNGWLNGCRGGAIYLHKALRCHVENVKIRNFRGDGVSFQITDSVTLSNCEISGCAGFGAHPGTGTLRARVEGCDLHHNGSDGLFVCWRVRHGLFARNHFHHNGGSGLSIGHQDTDNVFAFNRISENARYGIYMRDEKPQNGAHRNLYHQNRIEDNAGGCGVFAHGYVEGVALEENEIGDGGKGVQPVGVRVEHPASDIRLSGNRFFGPGTTDIIRP